jgi:hypothetical protein
MRFGIGRRSRHQGRAMGAETRAKGSVHRLMRAASEARLNLIH